MHNHGFLLHSQLRFSRPDLISQFVFSDPLSLVPTDGGRYDVSVEKRLKMPVYWEETPIEVRRGSWFFKGPMDNRFVPYDDEFAARLEVSV